MKYNFVLGKGSKKIKNKKWEISHQGRGGLKILKTFLFIFKHGLNHPEIKRIFFSKVGTPPTLSLHQWEISQLVFKLFLLCQFWGWVPYFRGTYPKYQGYQPKKKILCTKMLFRHHISNKKNIFLEGGRVPELNRENSQPFF